MNWRESNRSFVILRLVSFSLWSRYAHSFRIVLLTHVNEQFRRTNTGKLLLKQQALNSESESSVIAELLIWEGRGDNAKISEAVLRIDQPVLIWTEAPKNLRISATYQPTSELTYIILDGTWQEAKKIFRQGPDCLRSIPRISLEPTFKSNYKLRGNFGYVDRFTPVYPGGANAAVGDIIPLAQDSDSSLLCTAEVGASLLINHGHNDRAKALLDELETFQMTFQSYSTLR